MFSFDAPFWSVSASESASCSFVADWPTTCVPEPALALTRRLRRPVHVPSRRVRGSLVRLRDRACLTRAENTDRAVLVGWSLLRCPCGGPCGLAAAGCLAGELSRVGSRRGRPDPCDEQEEDNRGQRDEMTFHLSPFELSVAPVTVQDTGTGTWTDSSQPGRSSGEWDRLRGLGKRASRIRRPRPGAAKAKKPIAVARPKVKVLGAAPPVEVEEPAAPSGGGNSNGRRCPCDEACPAARAVGSARCCGRSGSDPLHVPCVVAAPCPLEREEAPPERPASGECGSGVGASASGGRAGLLRSRSRSCRRASGR